MHLTFRNVNDAFRGLVGLFAGRHDLTNGHGVYHGNPVVRAASRNGPVLKIDEPVTVTYTHPRERVLLNPARDANPFLHLYEALWMLAGRNDVTPLAYYAKQFREYSDDGKTLNGAYGYRWRYANVPGSVTYSEDEQVDQLDLIVRHLTADPTSRRAVLQMWNVEDDLLKVGPAGGCPRCGSAETREKGSFDKCMSCGERITDYPGASKDVCCNLSVLFSLREESVSTAGMTKDERDEVGHDPCRRLLDITITNRSNDLVWGLLGSNYVTFSVLQEYAAARLGAGVGRYHHFTNDLHVYTETNSGFRPDEWLAADRTEYREPADGYTTVPLVKDPAVFEQELPAFVEKYANPDHIEDPLQTWNEPFFRDVAYPMMAAHLTHRRRGATTFDWVDRIKADDWRVACEGWLERRTANVNG